jgi:LacI family transcriptional regulator
MAEADEDLCRWIAALERPAGVLCASDRRARYFVRCCQRAGIAVPDDASVVGVDNEEFVCALEPPALSSIPQSNERIGYEAAGILDSLMRGEAIASAPVLIPPDRVITRASSDLFGHGDPLIERAVRFIVSRAHENIGVADVARAAGVSRRTLEMRFVAALGRTPGTQIARARLDRAKMLLRNTDIPVKQVARSSGFRYASYLTSQLRRECGLSPLEYRSQYRHL